MCVCILKKEKKNLVHFFKSKLYSNFYECTYYKTGVLLKILLNTLIKVHYARVLEQWKLFELAFKKFELFSLK